MSTWTDSRYPRPVTYTVIEFDRAPQVYIAPADACEGVNEGYVNAALCEVGEVRMTRDELREWAMAIVVALSDDGGAA